MKMFVAGDWIGSDLETPVISPWNGDTIDMVPSASARDVEVALSAAAEGVRAMAALTPWERSEILHRAADLVQAELEPLAQLVSREEGKPISEARTEVSRCPALLRLAGFEGSQMR